MAIQRICTIDGCGKKHKGHGFCNAHFQRERKYGSLRGPARQKHTPSGEPMAFYLSVVLPYDGDECLIWPYTKTSGYGWMKKKLVSRMVCEETHGPPVDPKMEAAHLCGNGGGGCVTKKHLVWKTHTENQADRIAHGTSNRGSSHGMSKLTEDKVRYIRSRHGLSSAAALAEEAMVASSVIYRIWNKTRWGWLD